LSVDEFGNVKFLGGPGVIRNKAKGSELELREGSVDFGEMVGSVGGTMNDKHRAEISRLAFGVGFWFDFLV
jgi:hypothetical protein